MKPFITRIKLIGLLALTAFALSGCESNDGGNVSGSVYYGVGFYDPWYYGGYYDDPDIIVTPPDRPNNQPHPEHPIVKPSPTPRPTPRPMPSIPSMPRGGGGRFR